VKWKTFARLYKQSEVVVVVPHVWNDSLVDQKFIDDSEGEGNYSIVSLFAYHTGNEVRYRYRWSDVWRVVSRVQADILYVEQGDNSFAYFQFLLVSFVLGIRSTALFFTWVNWHNQWSLKYRLVWSWVEKFNRFFSQAAVVGNHDAQMILRDKAFKKPCFVIPQIGVEPPATRVVPAKLLERRNMVFLGRLVKEKGVYDLIEAFALVKDDFPDWNLVFIGQGPERSALERYAQLHGVSVKFEGALSHEQALKALDTAGILVLPSYDTPEWREQFGHVIIEAMSREVPVIGSTGGEIPRVVDKSGFVFQAGSVDGLSKGLRALMGSDKLRASYSQKGYLRVMERYTHEAIARATYDVFVQCKALSSHRTSQRWWR
jgi:glycosyltransferase involved in cell wall biosynthesis